MRAVTILVLVTVGWLVPLRLTGTTYYVAQNGNNAASGTIGSPWGSLQRASSGLRPGDTVLVRDGVYHERFVPSNAGAVNAPIVYRAFPGEYVEIDGSPDGELNVVAIYANHIVMEGFTITNQNYLRTLGKPDYWVQLEGNDIIFRKNRVFTVGDVWDNTYVRGAISRGIVVAGRNCTVEQCYVRGQVFGIVLGGIAPRNLIIRQDTVHATGQNNIDVMANEDGSTGYQNTLIEYCVLDTSFIEDNIQFEPYYSDQNNTIYNRGTIVRYNRMGNAAENAIDLKGAGHTIIDHNYLFGSSSDDDGPLNGHDISGGTGIETSTVGVPTRFTIVRYNVIWDHATGTTLAEGDRYINNVFLNNRRNWQGPNQTDDNHTCLRSWTMANEKRVFINNILGGMPNGSMLNFRMDWGDKFLLDHNLYYERSGPATFVHRISGTIVTERGIGAWKAILGSFAGYGYMQGKDQNSIEADPRFLNVPDYPVGFDPAWNFALQSGSPAIDAGMTATFARQAGNGSTSVVVDDAYFFCDGFGITEGDQIRIGPTEPVRILAVNYDNNTVTLAAPRTWLAGDGVHLAFEGPAPDIGAFEMPGGPSALPSVPSLVSPADGAAGLASDVTIAWSGAPGAFSYHVQLSLISDFGTALLDTSGLPGTALVAHALSGNTDYFWRVSGRNGSGSSQWSETRTFRTAAQQAAPSGSSLSSPADGATGVSTNPVLTWSATQGATSYRLQVSPSADFGSLTTDTTGVKTAAITLAGLATGTDYFWRVCGINAAGAGAWSQMRTFRTESGQTVPAATSLSSPTDGATGVSTSPILTWGATQGATAYRLQVSRSADFGSVATDRNGLSGTSFTLTGLATDTDYFWRVSGSNTVGAGAWSVSRRFRTVPVQTVPSAAVLATPADGTTGNSTNPVLSWNPIPGASSYRLQVSRVADFTSPVQDTSGLPVTSFTVQGLTNDTEYFWRVDARNDNGTGAWSPVWRLRTFALPAAVAANVLTNADFGQGANTWDFQGAGAGDFTVASPGYRKALSGKVRISQPGSDVQLSQHDLVLQPDTAYRLTFAAYSTTGSDMEVSLVRDDAPQVSYGLEAQRVQLGTSWQEYTFDFSTKNFSSFVNNARLSFQFGKYASEGDVYSIDRIGLGKADKQPPLPVGIPQDYGLDQNFPNPFNPRTTIRYSLPTATPVRLVIYDILGREVRVLVNQVQDAGRYAVNVDGDVLGASGVYLYTLQASGGFVQTRRLLYVK
jgi:hypothetical protein